MSFALVFPGQGSQFVGMGKDLASWSPAARETFEEADDALGYSISGLCFEGPEEDLRQTGNTQPAILTVSVAAYRVLAPNLAARPAFVAGHSLGEYSALVAAESISFSDAVRVVRERGRAMQEAVPEGEGSMAALLGMDRQEILSLCAEASSGGGPVTPANFNAPGQVVIAGRRADVQRAISLFREKGGKKFLELPVSAPFHCSLMRPAAVRMEKILSDIHVDSLKTVLINNAKALPLQDAREVVPSLVDQVTSPVLWEDSVRRMIAEGVSAFIEVGPGKVLAGLIRRIEGVVAVRSFGSPEDMDPTLALLGGRNA